MIVYLAKRLGLAVAVLLTAVLVLFSLLHFIPGDPATIALGPRATPEAIARYAAKMHLDEPLWMQFLIYVQNAAVGDLGVDVFSDRSVTAIIGERIGFTLALVSTSLCWAVLLGIPLGCFAAVRPNSLLDRITGVLSVGTIAI
ncbi:MAG: ABC transporter permease, partial [Gammaproteobacteria bacterium]|nr:ABC transporter permease [Gammaproteobacteria bacterium]